MPSYFKKIKFDRTPAEFLNKKILSAQEVEDLVEYLYSLKWYGKIKKKYS